MTRSKFFLPAALVSLTIAPCEQAFPADPMQLSGAANFRDIGGYRTADGHTIKSHVVYRSGELSGLTVSDRHVLSSLRIGYEIDLRTGKEREEAPSQWGENAPEVIAIPVGESRNSSPAASTAMDSAGLKTAEEAQRYLQQATVRIATQGAADIGEVIRRLAQGAEPALIHCTAGKDRTGVTVAVLMTVLGAPRDAVEREYMRSSEAIEQQLERMKARERTGTPSGFLSLQPEVLRTLLSTKPDYVEAVFRAIDEQYGSFDAYTRSGLKLSASQIQALRAMLLEP
jgi:protein-tyrosine phosphatase